VADARELGLRAGFPAGWVIAGKTGTAGEGTSNDVAYVQPTRPREGALPGADGSPLLVAAYLTGSADDPARRDAALADVARVITAWRAP
jgi:beta-lactamase class A